MKNETGLKDLTEINRKKVQIGVGIEKITFLVLNIMIKEKLN